MKSVLIRPPVWAGPPGLRVFDPSALGAAEIAAFADHPGAHLAAVGADGIVGAIAHVGVGFVMRLEVGADAAIPQQVDRHAQDGAHHLHRRRGSQVDAEQGAHFRGQRNRLEIARPDAAAA